MKIESKIIGFILDLLFPIAFIVMIFVMLFKAVPDSNSELFYIGFGALGSYTSIILNYYRSSTSGSKEKDETIKNLAVN